MSAAVSKSKIAIVTGGSRGLGRSTVLSLAKRGVGSIFTYNSNLCGSRKGIGISGPVRGQSRRRATQYRPYQCIRRIREART